MKRFRISTKISQRQASPDAARHNKALTSHARDRLGLYIFDYLFQMKKRAKKWGIRLGILLILLTTLFFLRKPIMRGMANFLAKTDAPVQVDAAFVLSGAAKERTIKAIDLYPAFAPKIITTGEMVSQSLQALGHHYTGSEVMRDALYAGGVDSTAVSILPKGTSTYEESEEILGYAIGSDFKRIMIISSLHHTRRIHNVFTEKFRDAGIEVNIQGASPIEYDPAQWWLSEEGLIFVTNEYLKLLYYWWRY